ncbi:DUF2442 domain-containing protein [Nostoc sp. 3335mG]|nr:DUF2442 domain-containing protein [Nostoc sp. 3335mG]
MVTSHRKSAPFDGLHWVVEDVVWAGEYKLKLWFRDGSVKIADLREAIFKTREGSVFEPLKDIDFFASVRLEGSSVAWDNDIDFAPEFLYEIGKDIEENKTGTKG